MKIFFSCVGIIISCGLWTSVFAEEWSRWPYGNTAIEVLDHAQQVGNINDHTVENRLSDEFNSQNRTFGSENRITNTLDAIRVVIGPYIQRWVYIGLVMAVIFIIYNGFLMVTDRSGEEKVRNEAKIRITNIIIGVLLLTGFYFIIKVTLSLVNNILR